MSSIHLFNNKVKNIERKAEGKEALQREGSGQVVENFNFATESNE
jgi:hypothetical protein